MALPPVAEVDETSRIEAGLAQYVGPFLGENLLHRVVELRRKVNISGGPNVQAFIRSKFEDANEEGGSGVHRSAPRAWSADGSSIRSSQWVR